MRHGAPGSSFGAHLKSLREAAGFTQEELATISGLSVHAVSALERGQRRRPHPETVRALATALDLAQDDRDALLRTARAKPVVTDAEAADASALPRLPTPLVGRTRDLEILNRWIEAGAARVMTLLGVGGVGKTRLALEIAHQVANDGAAQVVFVELAALRDAAFVSSAIAEAFGVVDETAADLARRVRAACANRQTLLVLDNCEHVLEAVPLLASLVDAVPSLRLLATSRAPLRMRGEREYVVEPLAIERDATRADADPAPAVRLLVDRIHDFDPEFRLVEERAGVVTAICRRLDALPLALELAAPWFKVLSADDLLRRLERDVLSPTIARRDLPERQQTMNATVAWSYRLLEPGEQRVFRRLGVLSGLFPIEAAAAVQSNGAPTPAGREQAQSAVAGLIERSLLQCVDGSCSTRPLYRTFETVRAYAALEMNAAGERDAALEGLVQYCLAEASLAAPGLLGRAQLDWLHRVRDDLESYRAALAWLIERGRGAEAADIAWKLMYFYVIRGHAAEGLRWYGEILKLPSLSASAECRALAGSSAMWFTLGAYDEVHAAATRSFARAQACGDLEIASYAELLLGHVEYGVGNGVVARQRFVGSLEGFRAASIPWGVANAMMGIAAVALASGDMKAAERLLDEVDPMLQTVGPWFSSLAAYVRAILALRRGSPDEAIAHVHGSLLNMRELHDNFAFVYALIPLAAAAALKGEDAWAARILGVRDAVNQRTGAAAIDKSVDDLTARAERDVRVRLGADRWNRAYAAGRRMSIDLLLKDIENVLNVVHQ